MDEAGRDWWVAVNYGDGWIIVRRDMPQASAERLATDLERVLAPGCEALVGQGDAPIPNPPWVTRTLALDWNMVQDHVAEHPSWMPAFSKAHASRKGELVAKMDALGCGVYGCVLPTNDAAVVLKLTTDKSEVEFATEVLPKAQAEAQAGVVAYFEAVPLHAKHQGRKVVALWRQSAENVGKILDPKVTRIRGERKHLADLIDHEWSVAQVALSTFVEAERDGEGADLYEAAMNVAPIWKPRPGDALEDILDELDTLPPSHRFAAALSYFRAVCLEMRGTALDTVGRALVAFLDAGVFVADIHEGNMGQVPHDGIGLDWVITDPGNTIVLPAPWRS
jgi:hypothetical protein